MEVRDPITVAAGGEGLKRCEATQACRARRCLRPGQDVEVTRVDDPSPASTALWIATPSIMRCAQQQASVLLLPAAESLAHRKQRHAHAQESTAGKGSCHRSPQAPDRYEQEHPGCLQGKQPSDTAPHRTNSLGLIG